MINNRAINFAQFQNYLDEIEIHEIEEIFANSGHEGIELLVMKLNAMAQIITNSITSRLNMITQIMRDEAGTTTSTDESSDFLGISREFLKNEKIDRNPCYGITVSHPVYGALMSQMSTQKHFELFIALSIQLYFAEFTLKKYDKKLTSTDRLYEASRLIRTLATPEGRWVLELIAHLDKYQGSSAQHLLEVLLFLRKGPAKNARHSIPKDLGAFAELLWIAFDLKLPDGMKTIFVKRNNKGRTGPRGPREKYLNRMSFRDSMDQDVNDYAPPEVLEILANPLAQFDVPGIPPEGSTVH